MIPEPLLDPSSHGCATSISTVPLSFLHIIAVTPLMLLKRNLECWLLFFHLLLLLSRSVFRLTDFVQPLQAPCSLATTCDFSCLRVLRRRRRGSTSEQQLHAKNASPLLERLSCGGDLCRAGVQGEEQWAARSRRSLELRNTSSCRLVAAICHTLPPSQEIPQLILSFPLTCPNGTLG